MVSAQDIKVLRDETGLSMMQCKEALEKSDGDKAKALEHLRALGATIASKKSDRTLGASAIVSYIHAGGKAGVLLELSCETDFVATNEDFKTIAKDIAMHVAAMKPTTLEELLAQPFIKDGEKTVKDLVSSAVQKFGENTQLSRVSWFALGGEGSNF